jgi:hypothetical protein
MESPLFEIDLLTGHEPGIPGGGTPPSTAGGTPAATDARFKTHTAGSSVLEQILQQIGGFLGGERGQHAFGHRG